MPYKHLKYLFTVLLLSACGFKPVHSLDGELHGNLANITIVMQHPKATPSRLGQVLENALADTLCPDGSTKIGGTKYNLIVQYQQNMLVSAMNTDSTVVRRNVALQVNYKLEDANTNTILAEGKTEAIDGFDMAPSQYANYTAERNTAERNALAAAHEIKMKILFALKQNA